MAAALLLSGCAGTGLSGDRTMIDGAGRTVAIPDTVERIACVGVGALRYTCYMESADLVVGVEDYEHETTVTRPYNFVYNEAFRAPYLPPGEGVLRKNPRSYDRGFSYLVFRTLSGNTAALIRSAGSTSRASAILKNTSREKE